MPASMVKPGQEKYWQRAKEQAEKQGHGGDWAYVVGIFKKMTVNKSEDGEELGKSVYGPSRTRYFINVRQGGQVPDKRRLRELAEAYRPAKPANIARLLDSGKPVFRLADVFAGLGLDPDAEASWKAMLGPAIESAPNEVALRQAIYAVMRERKAPGELGGAVLERARKYRAEKMAKSVRIVTFDELRKAGPYRGPRGGMWADPQHTVPWGSEEHHKQSVQAEEVAAKEKLGASDQRAAEALASVAKRSGWSKEGKRSFTAGSSRVSVLNRGGRWYVETGPRGDPSQGPRGEYGGTVAKILQSAAGERAHRSFALAARTAGRFMSQNRREPLEKAEASGGTYYRRVKGKTGRWRYYYDQEKYENSGDAHLDGEGASKRAVRGKVAGMMEKAGKAGLALKDLKPLTKRYGSKLVGGVLNDARGKGELTYKGGRLRPQSRKVENA